MDGNFYTETYTYREGRILIYKRPNFQNFQCRLRVQGTKGYIIKFCDSSNIFVLTNSIKLNGNIWKLIQKMASKHFI